jgi:thiol-disulfide isomerase/thioredoxin
MNRLIILVFLFLNNTYLFSQEAKVISFKTLESMMYQANDTTYIVNFFASWCAPCVKELPEFVAFAEQHKTKKMSLLFVSLDMRKDVKKKLGPLSIKLNLGQNLYLLDAPNANYWINQIDKEWSGAIPATLFINTKLNIKKLFNQSFSSELLLKTLETLETKT